MNIPIEEFYHDFRQDLLLGAEANKDFLVSEFALRVTKELEESGAIQGFDPCHYKATKGMRVDGYCFNDDGISLDLFIVDYENKEKPESLTTTDVKAIFNRLENYFLSSAQKKLYCELEETSPGYGLSRDIENRADNLIKINFHLVSERILSEKLQALEEKKHDNKWVFSYQIWDFSRLYRFLTSRGVKEELEIDFTDGGVRCLPAHIESADYASYLMVMPAKMLAGLYGKYGDRLLEQNVRCFLQARGKVNKGIRTTILSDPEMFFAYNNGITATAKEVKTETKDDGLYITGIRDFQIVNGGQTTASLFHTNRRDKASLDKIFVQLKLSVVDAEKGETVIPKISEYANTQNKVNAADFFANHPFHIRMEEFSRRIWAPVTNGAVRETKWFYERARGQYADAQAKITKAEKKKYQAEYPPTQMFSKTDLAKFENVWDDKPTYVNLGSQKNFARYASRIGQEWSTNPDKFNEYYYKKAIARGILFNKTERIVSAQPWYNGGYRANIVAYSLALLSKTCIDAGRYFNFLKVWELQDVPDISQQALVIISKIVNESIMLPIPGISNISEWCKKDACWDRLQQKLPQIKGLLPATFWDSLLEKDSILQAAKSAIQTQRIDNGIEAQKYVIGITPAKWNGFMTRTISSGILTPKEHDILKIATQMPNKIPSEKQSLVLTDLLKRAELEGIKIE